MAQVLCWFSEVTGEVKILRPRLFMPPKFCLGEQFVGALPRLFTGQLLVIAARAICFQAGPVSNNTFCSYYYTLCLFVFFVSLCLCLFFFYVPFFHFSLARIARGPGCDRSLTSHAKPALVAYFSSFTWFLIILLE